MNNKNILILSLAALASVSFTSAARAATATDTFELTIAIDGTCEISATNIAFGNVAEGSTNVDAEGVITVNCTLYTPYQIGLNEGLYVDSGNRRMYDGDSGYLAYGLYSDSGRTTAWGDTLDTDTVASTGTGSAEDYTVYARVPSTSLATSGGYADTVTATITF